MSVKLATKEYVDNRRAVLSVNLPLAVEKKSYTNSAFVGAKVIKVYVHGNNAYLDVFEFVVGLNGYTTKDHTLEYVATSNTINYSTTSWQVTNRAPAIRRIIVEY